MFLNSIRRKFRSYQRRLRHTRMTVHALKSPHHPILAHIIPMRRCNLECAYCNEYDKISAPVPAAEMFRRIDRLAELGTSMVTISGGEPLLHPDLDELVRHIRRRGMIAALITNGYLLTPARIKALNRAGLDGLQISVDNVQPDDVSKKSLKVLDKKLEWLAELAEFEVSINSVLGSSISKPEDALIIARRARELGLTSTLGIAHDHSGQLTPLEPGARRVFEEIVNLKTPFYTSALYNRYHAALAQGRQNDWHCRAGSRYLYVCEDGLVHYCSQQRGHPGIPLEQYTREHIDREYRAPKPCAAFCTISCVQRVSMVDEVRENPLAAVRRFFPKENLFGAPVREPFPVRALTWLLLPPEGQRQLLKRAALWLAGML